MYHAKQYAKTKKKKQFPLAEKRQAKQALQPKPTTSANKDLPIQLLKPGNPIIINQHFQTEIPGPSHEQKMHGPSKRKQHPQKRKTQPNKRTQSKPSDFHKKPKEAAIAQSKIAKANQRQRQFSHLSRVQLDTTQFANNKSIEVINLVSVSSQGSPVTIYTSHDPTTLMTTPSKKKLKNPAHTNRKIDKKN